MKLASGEARKNTGPAEILGLLVSLDSVDREDHASVGKETIHNL
jgi:hypothetical protein